MRNLLLALALSATTSTAFAADYAIYPGSMCVSYDGDPSVLSVDGGAIQNDDTSSVKVSCPIVRDTTTSTSMTVVAYAYDKNSDDDFSCELKARSMTSHDTVTTVSGSISGSIVKTITMSGLSLSSPSKVYLVCDIPPVDGDEASFITGYRVTEN